MNFQQPPIETPDTDLLLELILSGQDIGHIQAMFLSSRQRNPQLSLDRL